MDEKRQLDFQQRLRAFQYQRFRLKILHAIAEGLTTRLAGRQEFPAPRRDYKSAYVPPAWVPFQVSRPPLSPPSQDPDALLSQAGAEDAEEVDAGKFPEADLSDLDLVPSALLGPSVSGPTFG